jgi:glucose-1-phosphate thymidylyltransferase
VRGLVLAGGHGTRLRPLTSTGNKHMIPIANQPILYYGLKQLARVGIRQVGIVLGPIQEGIREAVGTGGGFGLDVTYIEQGPPRGLADAVRCARTFLENEPFLMYLGDNILEHGLASFVDAFVGGEADAVVGATPVADPHRYGIVELEGNKILSIEEKPRHPKSNLALVGVYVFDPKIHSIIESLPLSARGELEITDAIERLVGSGGRVVVQRVFGWWKDTGAPEDLLEANDLVLNGMAPEAFSHDGTISTGATVSGNVALGEGSVVEAGAAIEGPAVIGTGVRVGRGTVIGPGTSVGNLVELRGCSIRRTILLEGARIIGSVSVHDSLIGRNAEVHGYGGQHREVSFIIGDASRIRL